MNLSYIQNRMLDFPDSKFNGKTTNEDITRAEQFFGKKFPEDFRQYLCAFGSGYISSEEFLGIGPNLHENIDFVADRLRIPSGYSNFPPNLIPLRTDGMGNYDCIDLNKSNNEISCVVEWIHDIEEQGNCRILTYGFWKWMNKMLDVIEVLDTEE